MASMSVEGPPDQAFRLTYQQQTRDVEARKNYARSSTDPKVQDRVMLIRSRKSCIYFLRQFFDYPIQLSTDTLKKLGLSRTIRIGLSSAKGTIAQINPEKSLEEFFINRFGRELYRTFFKSYTEKVWGVPCDRISAEWGTQRIKGLSITKAIRHFLKKRSGKGAGGLSQKGTETPLIDKFLYPKYGPGQLWEYVAQDVIAKVGVVTSGWNVERLFTHGFRVIAAQALHGKTGERRRFEADYFFATMPIKELMRCLDAPVPGNVLEVSDGLQYRDFITVGVLLTRLAIQDDSEHGAKLLKDNWIYIQEPDVMVGRMQIFNNWSPYLVGNPDKVWIGLEYFCYETDEIWKKTDTEMIDFATLEMERIGIIRRSDVLDACVIRVPKTYPAYFGSYERFEELKGYINQLN